MQIETLPRRKHNISLTPLIDVVFILLLFFMLATNFTDWREITLATGTTATAQHSEAESIIVHIAADGQLRLGDDSYSISSLIPILKQRQAAGDADAIILHPDNDTTLGPTVAALDALAGTGLPVALSHPANADTDTGTSSGTQP